MWNAEWRHFRDTHDNATPKEIWQHAVKLIIKYDLTGARMVPYR